MFDSLIALYSLQQLEPNDDNLILAAIAGFLSSVQWTVWLFIPLFQVHDGIKLNNAHHNLKF